MTKETQKARLQHIEDLLREDFRYGGDGKKEIRAYTREQFHRYHVTTAGRNERETLKTGNLFKVHNDT